ncbi:MAG: Calx-beta domain-containing protein [Gemmataceae bacterium]
MSFHSWLRNLLSALAPRRGQRQHRRRGSQGTATHRPSLEVLEDRLTPSFTWVGTFPAALTPPQVVVTGDFNNDGTLDVATGADTVNMLAGNGDGTLQPPIQLADLPATPPSPRGDFTSDGIPDQVYRDVEGNLVVRPGRGDGTFGNPIYSQGPGGDLEALTTADLNGDGRLDLVLGFATTDTGGVGCSLLGRGDGTFGDTEVFWLCPDLSLGGRALAIGDFDNDGRPDIAAVGADSMGEGAVTVLLNDGAWPTVPPPPAPSIAIHDSTVAEGNAGAVAANFTVTLSAASTQTITVAYATADGTATAGSDYQATSGTLTFAPGATSKTVTVLVDGDRLAESNETFNLNLSGATNATIANGQGVGTIVDDEPRISISDVTKQEGRKGQTTQFTFTVTLSAAYDQPVTMSFRTADGTATTSDNDYVAKTGTITFNPGETTKTITIVVNGDSKKEANETFYLDLFGLSSNALFTKNRGIGTILNDD